MNVKEMKKQVPIFNADIGHIFDSKSVELKKKNNRFTMSYLFFLFLGALFADLSIKNNETMWLAIAFTAIALIFYGVKTYKNFIDQWTYTRVAAETIKSEWFKFTVGGGDYPVTRNDEQEKYYIKSFINKINETFEDYKENIRKSRGNPLTDFEISKEDVESNYRNESLNQRIEFYKKERIQNQQKWYESKTSIMKAKEKRYQIFFPVVISVGLILGILRLFNIELTNNFVFLNSDWFSIMIALAFALDAVNSLFQHERLKLAYEKSANDLSESFKKINDPSNDVSSDEEVFNEFVEDVENLISSEHKSWSLTTSTRSLLSNS